MTKYWISFNISLIIFFNVSFFFSNASPFKIIIIKVISLFVANYHNDNLMCFMLPIEKYNVFKGSRVACTWFFKMKRVNKKAAVTG